jgi:hypothetical protein
LRRHLLLLSAALLLALQSVVPSHLWLLVLLRLYRQHRLATWPHALLSVVPSRLWPLRLKQLPHARPLL